VLKTLLYILSALSLVCAGFVFIHSVQVYSSSALSEQQDELSIIDKFHQLENLNAQNDKDVISPLVKQTSDFALYLDPPKPPAQIKEQSKPSPIPPLIARMPVVSAKFKVLATSCNRDKPQDSIALIDEPGRGEHWVKIGDPIGHFVLEKIENGFIIYRSGNQSREMAVEINKPLRIAQERIIKI